MSSRVIVAGGGPAGLAAAGCLARGGFDVTLLEAGLYPRTKLCGEFLSPDAEQALESLGVADLADRLGAPFLSRLRVTASSRGRMRAEMKSPLPSPGRGVSRFDLDAALATAARAAGVDVRERARVTHVSSHELGVTVRSIGREHVADALIVATGRLARPSGVLDAVSRARRWVGAKLHVRGLDLSDVTELHFVRGAYVGLNAVTCGGDRRVNVCALARQDFWDAAGASVGGLMAAIAARSPAFASRWEAAHAVAASSATAAGFTFERRGALAACGARPAIVCGDAAVLIAPLAGDGQAMALTAGVAAARSLIACSGAAGQLTAAGVGDAAREFATRFRRDMRVRLWAGSVLQAALLRPATAVALVRSAAAVRSAPAWLYRATRGPITDQSAASVARSS